MFFYEHVSIFCCVSVEYQLSFCSEFVRFEHVETALLSSFIRLLEETIYTRSGRTMSKKRNGGDWTTNKRRKMGAMSNMKVSKKEWTERPMSKKRGRQRE